jgi:endonuclease/exonuclease/phosphatase family metal-dependent hydrolase
MTQTAPAKLRCLTLNLWGAEEPLAARMRVVIGGLRELAPDVVALQEVLDVPGVPNQAATIADALGWPFVFAEATAFRGGHEGLAILSRFPIAEAGAIELPHAQTDERRILLSAKLAHAAGGVWVHTTHLNYRLQHGRERADQVSAIDAALRERPSDLPQILMGDFNARPESDEIRFLRGHASIDGRRGAYQDAWAVLHPELPGVTWASSNPYTRRLWFLGPDRRLDYVFVTPRRRDGRGNVLLCHLAFDAPDAEGVWASDHFGVVADVQLEPDAAKV